MGIIQGYKKRKKEKERKIVFSMILSISKVCAFRVTQELNGYSSQADCPEDYKANKTLNYLFTFLACVFITSVGLTGHRETKWIRLST